MAKGDIKIFDDSQGKPEYAGTITVQGSVSVIGTLMTAYDRQDIDYRKSGAALLIGPAYDEKSRLFLTTRDELKLILSLNPALKAQFDRDALEVAREATVGSAEPQKSGRDGR